MTSLAVEAVADTASEPHEANTSSRPKRPRGHEARTPPRPYSSYWAAPVCLALILLIHCHMWAVRMLAVLSRPPRWSWAAPVSKSRSFKAQAKWMSEVNKWHRQEYIRNSWWVHHGFVIMWCYDARYIYIYIDHIYIYIYIYSRPPALWSTFTPLWEKGRQARVYFFKEIFVF